MTIESEQKLSRLRKIMRDCSSVLVAYSGGVDSALVMAVAHQELRENALACIGVSPSYPAREMRDAVALAGQLGVPYRLVNTQEQSDPNYAANAGDRCYFCKSDLFDRLRAIAAAEGWDAIADGSHVDDLSDHVHGLRAGRERGVRSPLAEAGLTKRDVRDLTRHLGLPVWDKPAMACLASRVPVGTPVMPALLKQIEAAEDVLAGLGLRQFRVRHHGNLARIELPLEDLARAVEYRERIAAGLRAVGYQHVTLDLNGFRQQEAHNLGAYVQLGNA